MYKILRVAPNKDDYAKAYDLLIGWIKPDVKNPITFDKFYNKVETIYMIQDNITKQFAGAGYISFGTCVSNIPYLNGQCWNLSILVFDNETNHRDPERYRKVYDLIFTICRDKKDKPIIIRGINDEDVYVDIINALKNNKFKRYIDSDGEIIWFMIPSMFDCLSDENSNSSKKIDLYNDEDVLDEYCIFPNKQYEGNLNNEHETITIEPPEKFYCRHVECRGCEYFNCCKPNDKCRFDR